MAQPPLKFKTNCSSFFPIVALGTIAIAAGLYHQRAGGVALGAACLVGPGLVYALFRFSLRGLKVRLRAPPSAFEGDTVTVSVTLTNGSRLPLFFPVVSDIFGPQLHEQKDLLFEDRILPGETMERSYEGNCVLPRGVYALGPAAISLSDPFGWFQLRLQIKEARSIKVYPRIQDFGVNERLGACLSYLVSDLTHRGIGESTEFAMVREYRRGDPLRRVHWGLTAHLGTPVVKEFSRNAVGDLTIFLDPHRASLVGVGRSSSFEHAVKITAAVAAHSLARGHRVQLTVSTDDALRVTPSGGNDQLQRILDVLVEVKPNSDVPLGDALVKYASDVKPGSAVMVMLSPTQFDDAEILRLLLRWRRQRVHVLAVVFDVATFRRLWDAPPGEQGDSREFAERLRAHGIQVYLVPCAADLRRLFAGGEG